jgi:D-sedoheptulose 7-phosphate isomerase
MISLSKSINQSIFIKKKILNLKPDIEAAIKKIYDCLKNNGKIIICGNGGSAADSQHLATELAVRLKPRNNRKALSAMSLSSDATFITACGNDFGFDNVFSRNLESIGKKDDILIALSTSGNSKNIINVLKSARKKKIYSISFLGNSGGDCKKYSNLNIIIPSNNTARIQETYMFVGHYILERVEEAYFKKNR